MDHQPLIGVLSDRSLADIDNPRLLLLKEKTLWFRFLTIYVPGKFHCGPDYMSRNSVDKELTTKQARISCLTGLAINGNKEGSTMRNVSNRVQLLQFKLWKRLPLRRLK